jgi:hypothetical protein
MGVFRAAGQQRDPHDLTPAYYSPTGAIDLALDELRASWSKQQGDSQMRSQLPRTDMSSEQRQLIRLVSTILPRSGDEDVDQDKAQELLVYLLHQGVDAGHFSGNDVRCLMSPGRGLLSLDNARQQAIVSLLRELRDNDRRRADIDQAQSDPHSRGLPLPQYAKAVIDLSTRSKSLAASIDELLHRKKETAEQAQAIAQATAKVEQQFAAADGRQRRQNKWPEGMKPKNFDPKTDQFKLWFSRLHDQIDVWFDQRGWLAALLQLLPEDARETLLTHRVKIQDEYRKGKTDANGVERPPDLTFSKAGFILSIRYPADSAPMALMTTFNTLRLGRPGKEVVADYISRVEIAASNLARVSNPDGSTCARGDNDIRYQLITGLSNTRDPTRPYALEKQLKSMLIQEKDCYNWPLDVLKSQIKALGRLHHDNLKIETAAYAGGGGKGRGKGKGRGEKWTGKGGKQPWVKEARSNAQSAIDSGNTNWQPPDGKGKGKGKGSGKGKSWKDRRGWKVDGLKRDDLWPMFAEAAKNRGETKEFAESEWERRKHIPNDEIREHAGLYASDVIYAPNAKGVQTQYPVCAVCAWAGDHQAHTCHTTEPGYVPQAKRRAQGKGKDGW